MAAPTNISAATATDIPFSTILSFQAQLVSDAGTTYEVWFKVTAPDYDTVISAWAHDYGDDYGYDPLLEVYAGPDTSPVSLGISSQGKSLQFPVLANQTYYLQVYPNFGNPSPANLMVEVQGAPKPVIPIGVIGVNDDSELSNGLGPLPLTFISTTTGEVLGFKPSLPSGEWGDVLPDGSLMASDYANGNVQVFDSDFNLVTTITKSGSSRIRSNLTTERFWLGTPTNPPVITSYTSNGTLDKTETLTGITNLHCLGTNSDESILYFTDANGTNKPIKRWDLVNHQLLSDLYAGVVGEYTWDIIVLTDDTIIASYTTLATGEFKVRRFDTSGTVINTYNIAATSRQPSGTSPRLASAPDDPNSFWAWHHDDVNVGTSVFTNIKVSDGSIINSVTSIEYEVGVYEPDGDETPQVRFGNSYSCFFYITRTTFGEQEYPGTLRVIKIATATPYEIFTFTAGGGLTPASFTLANLQEQLYTDLTPGTYSIVETPVPGFDTTYSISNGSPYNAITVASGEYVTVTVTNTANPAEGGIYKIVPLKREDTLYTVFNPETTVDVKIPDPFIRTGLIGE